jgi:cyclophilin family peptidyl-prolyl cis-trans isomerase
MSCRSQSSSNNYFITFKTTLGDITVRLYDETPLHRDNFIKLINSRFYEGISFHRVIKGFMIQAGDPRTRGGLSSGTIDSLNNLTIPSEIKKEYFHKKGALAAARQGSDINPFMRSSGTQFYIVQGIKLTDDELNGAESVKISNIKQSMFIRFLKEASDSLKNSGSQATEAAIQEQASIKMFDFLSSYPDLKISDDQRNVYKTTGGVPRLDGTYTVFGEVVEGLDVVDRIADVPTDNNDKPLTDIKILKTKITSKP